MSENPHNETGPDQSQETGPDQSQSDRARAAAKRTVIISVLVSVFMLGFGFALVPLYDVFCDLTGFGGRVVSNTSADELAQANALPARNISLRLDSTVGSIGRFEFYPQADQTTVLTGKMEEFHFTVINKANIQVIGQAIPSIVPAEAAPYVKKVECFCFTQQVLEPNQEVDLPVLFYVDSRLPADIDEITLSYVYYDASEQHLELLSDHSNH